MPASATAGGNGYSFDTARFVWAIFSSYPHVLLACSGFGIAFLVAQSRTTRLVAA